MLRRFLVQMLSCGVSEDRLAEFVQRIAVLHKLPEAQAQAVLEHAMRTAATFRSPLAQQPALDSVEEEPFAAGRGRQSSVFLPMTERGGARRTCGNCAVARVRTSSPACGPGAMTPPRKTPSAEMQSKVVAVPRSTTTVSRP